MFDQLYFGFNDTDLFSPDEAESRVPLEPEVVHIDDETNRSLTNRNISDKSTSLNKNPHLVSESTRSTSQPGTPAARSTVSSNVQQDSFYCPHAKCPRATGGKGFKRRDNAIAHRRNVHRETIDRLPSGRAAKRTH
jgi:hypothetical protein